MDIGRIVKHNNIDLDVIYCVDRDRDFWLIDELYEDAERFYKHSYYIAERIGDIYHILSERIGSSYDSPHQIKHLVDEVLDDNQIQRNIFTTHGWCW